MGDIKSKLNYFNTIGLVAMEGRGFSNPVDIAIDSTQRIYVLSRTNPDQTEGIRIGICNMDSEYFGDFGEYGTGKGQFIWPTSIVFDSEDRLFLADEYNNRISVFDKSGKFIFCWGEKGNSEGKLNGPSGIAFDIEGNLLVVDHLNNRIQRFTDKGEFISSWGQKGSALGQFNLPWGISVNNIGEVIVSDWRNNRIQKFSSEGEILNSYHNSNGLNIFNRPSSAVMDDEGYLYVADWGNERVKVLNSKGKLIQELKGEGSLSVWAEEFLDANLDQKKFRNQSDLDPKLDSNVKTAYEASSRVEKYFWGPISIKIDNQGYLYVVETNRHRLQVYSILKDV
ncbi:MAG: NHL repeat-containing protein [Dehalococcoidia bacterium]